MSKKLMCLALFTILLGAVEARAADVQWIRACYYDTRYGTGWAGDGTATKNALVAAGYTALNADELKTWMQDRIKDKKYSVVVFSQDWAPDTVVESEDANCTLRKYLNAGGKIVWYSDIPFYYQALSGGTSVTWGDNGAVSVLGIGAVNLWDSGNTVKITAAGARWGLTQTWASVRPIASSTANIEVLATDNGGNAAAWVKHFVANDKFRGFVRFYDTNAGQAAISIADIMRVAEYVGNKASNPRPTNGAPDVTIPLLQWDASSFAVFQDVYFGTDPNPPKVVRQSAAMTMFYYLAGLVPGTTYYWRVDSIEADGTVRTGDAWSFTALALKASVPSPTDGATGQFPGVTLTWLSGRDGLSAHVYFGPDKTAVANGDASTDQGPVTEASFGTPALRASTSYYWRVDTINVDSTVLQGDVWSFTTMDAGPTNKIACEVWTGIAGTAVSALTSNANYPNNPTTSQFLDSWLYPPGSSGASDTANFYGDRLFGWLKPPQTGDYTFWIAGDDASELWLSTDASPANATVIAQVTGWTDAMDWDGTTGSTTVASLKSAPITLQAGQKYFIMTLHKEGDGGDSVGVAWQGGPITTRELLKAQYIDTFSLPPLVAFGPSPTNGAVDTLQTLTLTWNAGDKAQQHAVYLGDDANAVGAADTSSPLFKGQQAGTSFDTGELEWGKTYYWRVDEINTGEADSPWKGNVWSFTTANYIPVDDFESYTDEDVGRIFQTWIDGWGYTTPEPGNPGNGTGSTVGYTDAPFAEHQIVHGGNQSMPLAYDNSVSPNYSETERTFDSPQNWTDHGMNTLSLWVRGYPEVNNVTVTETGGKMTLTGDGSDIWNASDDFTYAFKSLNGDATIVARVANMGTGTQTWAKAGVMIRDSLDGNSMFAMMVITANTDGTAGNGASFQYRNPSALLGGNTDSTAVVAAPYWVKLERIGDTFTGYVSPDGSAWTMIGSQDVIMTAPVYIGPCITSHLAGEQRTFQFESIKTTGGVTGAWQGAAIASPRYNTAQDLYVAIQDSTNKVAVVKDATAVNSATWFEVQMPLSSFSGVSMTKVKKMIIGVGDRNNPAADGTGMLFIDDIRSIKP